MSRGKPQPKAWFESLNDPSERHDLDEVVYTDRQGDLLQVVHDMDELAKTPAEEWKKLFDSRAHRNQWPYGSGVWGKKEWVLPDIDNDNVVSMYEGHTNLFWAERYGREIGIEDLWLKLCGNSHTGSFKDLGMTVLVSQVKQMISKGVSIPAVACASTGDTSAALAAYAAAAGIPAVVFLPRGKISLAQLIQPVANGAIVFALDTDFDGCMNIVKQVAEKDGVYLANSMNSLRIEGQKTVGLEIAQQLDWNMPDWLVIPGGNLGNVSALAKGLDMLLELGLISKRPRICVGQAEAANPLYVAYQKDFKVFEPMARANDSRVGDSNRKPGFVSEGGGRPQALRRSRRAGDGRRDHGGVCARRSNGSVQLPAHRRCPRRASEAAKAGTCEE